MRTAPASRRVLIASIVLVALNLRPALSSIGPVLPEAMRDTGLNPATSWVITTAPVVLVGFAGLAAPRIAHRVGAERTVFLLLLALAAGLALRAWPFEPTLIAGCALGGVAIGTINVLAPSIIKREFPDAAARLMGLYTMALCAGAAIAAGATAPLERATGGGWSFALAVWAAPALVAALVWLPQLRAAPVGTAVDTPSGSALWRDPLAWQVTSFMGLQSSLAYCTYAWLAPILRSRGYSAVDAGFIVSISLVIQAPAALVAPWLVVRARDQRLGAAACVLLTVVGFMGCLYGQLSLIGLWSVILGAGQGASFAVALAILVLRAPDAPTAGRLSAMAQGVGYTFASGGPLLMGLLRGLTGGWDAPALVIGAIGLLCLLASQGAGRAVFVRSAEIGLNSRAPNEAVRDAPFG